MKKIIFLLTLLLSMGIASADIFPQCRANATAMDRFIRTNGESETTAPIPFQYGADFLPQTPYMPAITFGSPMTGIGSYEGGLGSIVFYMYGGILGEMVQVSPTEVLIDWMDITVFQEDVILEAGFIVNQLAGDGNAYACLDSEGRLFRSNQPCRGE